MYSIAACGMNCGTCLAYLREKNHCPGCRAWTESVRKYCMSCVIRNCDRLTKTSSGFCYDCERYPCTRLRQLDKRYRTRYRTSFLENLEFIRVYGLESFQKREYDRWHCPDCGGTICIHRGYCLQCREKPSGNA